MSTNSTARWWSVHEANTGLRAGWYRYVSAAESAMHDMQTAYPLAEFALVGSSASERPSAITGAQHLVLGHPALEPFKSSHQENKS
jgi:hypothetical protein